MRLAVIVTGLLLLTAQTGLARAHHAHLVHMHTHLTSTHARPHG